MNTIRLFLINKKSFYFDFLLLHFTERIGFLQLLSLTVFVYFFSYAKLVFFFNYLLLLQMQSILFPVFSNFTSDLHPVFPKMCCDFVLYLCTSTIVFLQISISLPFHMSPFHLTQSNYLFLSFSQGNFPFSSPRFFHVFRQVYLSASLSVFFQLTPRHLGALFHVVFRILKESSVLFLVVSWLQRIFHEIFVYHRAFLSVALMGAILYYFNK